MTISVYQAENVDALVALSVADVRVQFIYLDPPFATGKTQTGKAGSYSDTGAIHEWSSSMRSVLTHSKAILDDCGSIVLHCDWRTSTIARMSLDLVFGFESFASEIIWSYKRWPAKTKNFQRTHDTLLRYVKCPGKQRWNQLYQPLSESTVKAWGDRSQRAEFVEGKRKRSTNTSQASPGAPLGDVWEIPILAPVSRERTGYPTQKPEALLERLILSCTNDGDTVLDPFLGSGTTLAVAQRLGRNGIGVDRNPQAIEVSKKRLGLNA